jgi:arsenate reductase (thioredoxin)
MDGVRRRPAVVTILFVCLHGSAKSLIAAEYLNRLAGSRGLALRGESMGVEPDVEVPAAVVTGLAADGIDVREYVPRAIDAEHLASAAHVVSFGCDLPPTNHLPSIERWDDLPMVSDGFANARDAIVRHVEQLLDVL